MAWLVEPEKLKPGDLVGVTRDSYLILDTLPSEYDSRVKAMEVDTRPTEQYSRRVGQADPGAGGGRGAPHDTQGQVPDKCMD